MPDLVALGVEEDARSDGRGGHERKEELPRRESGHGSPRYYAPLSNTGRGYGRLRRMTGPPGAAYGYAADKDKLQKRLARIEGQVRGVSRMIEDDRYCIDILTQLAAIDTALEAVALKVLEEHVRHCVAAALASGDEAEANRKAAELLDAVQRFARTR